MRGSQLLECSIGDVIRFTRAEFSESVNSVLVDVVSLDYCKESDGFFLGFRLRDEN